MHLEFVHDGQDGVVRDRGRAVRVLRYVAPHDGLHYTVSAEVCIGQWLSKSYRANGAVDIPFFSQSLVHSFGTSRVL